MRSVVGNTNAITQVGGAFLELWLSGKSNKSGEASLGGEVGAFAYPHLHTGVLNFPFGNITNAERVAGFTDYRCVFLKNADPVNTWTNVRVKLATLITLSFGASIQVGVCVEGKNSPVQILPNRLTAPAGVTFVNANPLEFWLGVSLGPGEYIGLWIKRTYPVNGINNEDRIPFTMLGDAGTTRTDNLAWGVCREVAVGPILQWVRDRTARAWFKLTAAGTGEVRIGERSWSKAVAAFPFTGVIEMTDLEPRTKYSYTYWVNGVQVGGPWSFVTMPTEGQPGRFVLFFISDHHNREPVAGQAESRYETLLTRIGAPEKLPKLCIMDGDLDIPPARQTGTHTLDRRLTSLTVMMSRGPSVGVPGKRQAFHSAVPTYYIWDDWDFLGDNSAASEINPVTGRHAVIIPGVEPSEFVRTAVTAFDHLWTGQPRREGSPGIEGSFLVADVAIILTDARSRRQQSPATAPGAIGEADRTAVPWDPETCSAWGADQLAWIKSQLAAHAAAPLKILVVGDNLLDNHKTTDPSAGARDSIGLWHRGERNDLLFWLRDNPAAARGLVVLKGDDHLSMVHRCRRWRPPDPFVGPPPLGVLVATPDLTLGRNDLAEIVQVGGNFGGPEGNIARCWEGHPDETLWSMNGSTFWEVLVDTRGDHPKATFNCRSCEDGRTVYAFEYVDGQFYTPQSLYRSLVPDTPAVDISEPAVYGEDAAAPATIWTEEVAP